jgi:hypothetical protein
MSTSNRAEQYKAARLFRELYPEQSVDALALLPDLIEKLRSACEVKGDNFYHVMSSSNADLDDTASRRISPPGSIRTLPEFVSSASSYFPSDSSRKLTVVTSDREEILSAKCIHGGDNIIRQSAFDRLNLQAQRLDRPIQVNYGEDTYVSQTAVSFTWHWRTSTQSKTEKSTFHVVGNLPDVDIVVGQPDYLGGSFGTFLDFPFLAGGGS